MPCIPPVNLCRRYRCVELKLVPSVAVTSLILQQIGTEHCFLFNTSIRLIWTVALAELSTRIVIQTQAKQKRGPDQRSSGSFDQPSQRGTRKTLG